MVKSRSKAAAAAEVAVASKKVGIQPEGEVVLEEMWVHFVGSWKQKTSQGHEREAVGEADAAFL